MHTGLNTATDRERLVDTFGTVRRRLTGLRDGWVRFLSDERGSVSVEYALLLCLLVVTTAGAWVALGAQVRGNLIAMTDALSHPVG